MYGFVMTSLLPHALDLASVGFSVFPLAPNGLPLANCPRCDLRRGNSCPEPDDKWACECLHCHSFFSSSDEQGMVQALWSDERTLVPYLIGIATGSLSRCVVLDFDRHAGGTDGVAIYTRLLEEELLPPTVTARTGGGGVHLFYGQGGGDDLRTGRPLGAVGMDLKADLGYVIAAPSRKEGAKHGYVWAHGRSPMERKMASLPLTLREMLTPPERHELEYEHDPLANHREEGDSSLKLYDWFLNNFEKQSQGGRNNYLFRASCTAGEAVAERFMSETVAVEELTDAALAVGLNLSEIRKTIAQGVRRGFRNVAGE